MTENYSYVYRNVLLKKKISVQFYSSSMTILGADSHLHYETEYKIFKSFYVTPYV